MRTAPSLPVGRFLEADKVMTKVDSAGRKAYEERVAHSEPTPLEGADAEEAEHLPKQPVG